MRIACLVLAYSAAPVLGYSIPLLRAAGFDVYVHLDAKVRQEEYSRNLGESATQCHFVEDPVRVFWGGYSMVEAEIRLLEAARRAGPYDKYILLSDDSFPALPPPELARHFATEEDQVSVERQANSSPFFARYEKFFCYDHEATTVRGSHPSGQAALRSIDEALEAKIFEVAVLRKNGKKAIDLYYGSQFWALTARSVDIVLQVAREDLHLRKSFEYSALPDESMFQSILGNYVYKKRLDTGPVYVDFSGGGPRVIARVEDLPRDLQVPHAFIRKFSPHDLGFLDSLAQRLRSGLTIGGTKVGAKPAVQLATDDKGQPLAIVRLCAPEGDAGKSWHGIESFWGRRFRWTAVERIKWSLETDITAPGRVRFVVATVVSSGTDWMGSCRLGFNGIELPARLVDGQLIGEFEHAGLQRVEVELVTPTPRSPSETIGSNDTRRLGLSVAL